MVQGNDCGASSVEYAVLIALIALVIVGGVWAVGSAVGGLFGPLVEDCSHLPDQAADRAHEVCEENL